MIIWYGWLWKGRRCELGNTEWKGERHKSARKMMNGGRRQRFEGCMHWQSLEASATVSPKLNQRMRWKEWKEVWHVPRMGGAVTCAVPFKTPPATLLFNAIFFLHYFFPPRIYCFSFMHSESGWSVRVSGASRQVCMSRGQSTCMNVRVTASLFCACESGRASRVTAQVCEWTRGSRVARWKLNVLVVRILLVRCCHLVD